MRNPWMGLLELSLVFGLVLAWAVRELVKLKRDNRAADARREAERQAGLEVDRRRETRAGSDEPPPPQAG
ncbi:MAG: hypothetical protein KGI90_05395 [Burkholderiales bacterium]|nr:hypothetical protein [Burkholderiales bacterium]MDE2275558.1 hypothetical protein [Burkholderiales bacterium]